MDLNTDTLQSLAVGASGGVPLTLFLLGSMKSLRDSFDALSARLIRLEVMFEATCRDEIKKLTGRIEDIEKVIERKKEEN